MRFLVDSYLQTAHINDCGLSAHSGATSGRRVRMGLHRDWMHRLPRAHPDRQPRRSVQVTIGGATVNMLCTTVHISYPYQWHFNNVIQLLVPGANYSSLGNIQSNATAVNMD